MDSPTTRILLVTRNLPPLVGGMENLLLHCAKTLGSEYSLTLIGPRGCSAYLDKSIEVHEVPSSLVGFLLLAPVYAMWCVVRRQFGVVFGGSGLAAPVCWLVGKLCRATTCCYVHGLDVVVDNWLYQTVFVRCLRRLDFIIVNSSNTRRLCVEAGIEPERVTIIHPGCDIPVEVDRVGAREAFRTEYDLESSFLMLFVGRVAPRKGLLAFMRNAFPELLRRCPDAVLLIAGDSPDESLAHRGDELAKVAQEVETNGWRDRVRFLGKVDDDALSRCYAAADCLLFPLVPVAGDVEGFGMVAIEAAAHGTPTVAFAEGGVGDAVRNGVSGRLVSPGDYGAMIEALLSVAYGDDPPSQCREHAMRFGWDVFDKKFISTINEAKSN
jgi:phosphatidyl-myo-inositol dimannoside synthase